MKNNTSGYNGVFEHKTRKKWEVKWYVGGVKQRKYFSYGPRSLYTREEALTKAVAYQPDLTIGVVAEHVVEHEEHQVAVHGVGCVSGYGGV